MSEPYRAALLDGADLVFAATDDPGVNEAVVRDARERGALVCRADADEDEPGDFITPAKWHAGALIVAVSAGSAALAAAMRDQIARSLDPAWIKMADVMQSLRPAMRKIADPQRRREVFRALASEQAVRTLGEHDAQGLRRWLSERFPDLKDL